jgi:hypothetical protein
VQEVHLGQRRDVSDLFEATFSLFGRHAALFLAVTLVVVAPVDILVDGVWARGLADGPDAHSPLVASLASALLHALVVPSMVTALHVVNVQRLGQGIVPSIGEAFDAAADRVSAVIATVALYALIVIGGFLLLIVPGIWLSVRLYFGAQVAVVDGVGPAEALRRSSRLVDGRWWSTFGRLLLGGIIFSIIVIPLYALVAFVDNGVLFVLASIVLDTVSLSLTALFGTLLFFDLRARRGGAVAAPEASV